MKFNHNNKSYSASHASSKKHDRTTWESIVRWSKITGVTVAALGVVGTGAFAKVAFDEHKDINTLRAEDAAATQVSKEEQLLGQQITPSLAKSYQKSLGNPNAEAEDVVLQQLDTKGDYKLNYEIVIPNGKNMDVTSSKVTVKNGDAQISGGYAGFVPDASTLKLLGR